MSVSDIGWRRLLYAGAGLSFIAIIVLIFFVVLQVENQPGMTHGGDWILIGIQILVLAGLAGTGYLNRRESILTRILLVFIGLVALGMGLLGFLAVSQETDITLLWKAIRICAIDDLIIGIIAIYACI